MKIGPCASALCISALSGASSGPACQAMYHEALRPQFHFTSRSNWLNDPNGLVFFRGQYHLFFQHNPKGLDWGNMTWGHAVSRDLIHWIQQTDAILPDQLGTVFSGSAVVDERNTAGLQTGRDPALVAMYTAAGGTSDESRGQPFTQCLAFSGDLGKTWSKYPMNPVLPHLVGENRDPKMVWFEPTRSWIVALFLDGDTYALFSSPDLKSWRQIQSFHVPGCGECPDFFPMPVAEGTNRKWVFTAANGKYLVGDFDGKTFTFAGEPLQVDFGANYYAVQTFSGIPNSDGRRIQIAWMNGGRYPGMPFNQQMSFPCSMTLRETRDGLRIFRQPIREISELYGAKRTWKNLMLKRNDDPLANLSGDLWDLEFVAEAAADRSVELSVRGEVIRYDFVNSTLSSGDRTAPLMPNNRRVKVRVLIDRTSIEVFGNDGEVSLTSCFLPKAGGPDISLRSGDKPVSIKSLTVRALKSAWEN